MRYLSAPLDSHIGIKIKELNQMMVPLAPAHSTLMCNPVAIQLGIGDLDGPLIDKHELN